VPKSTLDTEWLHVQVSMQVQVLEPAGFQAQV
jgi:hypothetical protein